MVLAFMLLTAVMVRRLERAVEMARVNEALKSEISERRRGAELHRLSGQLLRLQDEERRKIARDLHDSTAQHLVALTAILQQLQNSLPPLSHKSRRLFAEAEDLAAQALREVRTLSYVLYPSMLDEGGMEDAICHYVEGYSERSGVHVGVQVSADRTPGRDTEMALFGVVQENLTSTTPFRQPLRAHPPEPGAESRHLGTQRRRSCQCPQRGESP
jgi:signal transduction histidine kinase